MWLRVLIFDVVFLTSSIPMLSLILLFLHKGFEQQICFWRKCLGHHIPKRWILIASNNLKRDSLKKTSSKNLNQQTWFHWKPHNRYSIIKHPTWGIDPDLAVKLAYVFRWTSSCQHSQWQQNVEFYRCTGDFLLPLHGTLATVAISKLFATLLKAVWRQFS